MKSWKKRLAVMLSAAMVMTAATGIPGYGRSSAASLKTALASVRTEGNSGAASEAKVTPSDAEIFRASPSNAVAEVDGTEFKSLQDAVDAADAGDEIVLVDDISNMGTITVEKGKNLSIDLAGHTIEAGLKKPDRHEYAIENYGTLLLKDSSGGGRIRARGIQNLGTGIMTIESGTYTDIDANGGAAVWNEAELYIKGGTFTTEYVGSSSDQYGPGCLNSQGKAVISGGTFEGASKRTYAIISTGNMVICEEDGVVAVTGAHGAVSSDGGTLDIYGGTFTSTEFYGLYVSNDGAGADPKKAAVNIYGGEFTGPSYSVWLGSDVNDPVDSVINIWGGVFHKDIMLQENAETSGAIRIYGGTYGKALKESLLARGYHQVKNGDQTYTVQAQSPSASVGDRTFATLEDAFRAARDGETITMLKSVEETDGVMLDDGRELTVDLNGCDITFQANGPGTDHFFGVKHGSLRLTGSGTVAEKEGGEYFGPVYLWGSKDPEDASYTCLTVDESVTLKGFAGIFVGANENAAYGVQVEMNGAIETVPDTRGDTGYAIYVNGGVTGISDNCPKILVGQNARIDSAGLGLYLAGYADTVIGGQAEINSVDGIEIRAGKLLIQEDAVIRATNTKTDVEGNPSGSTTLGSAIAVAQHDTKLPISVEVTGGTISGCIPFRESNPQGNSAEDLEKIELAISGGRFETIGDSTTLVKSDDFTGFITGGTYSGPLEEKYLADGYIQIKLENGDHMVAAEDGVSVSLDRNSMSMTVDQTETLKAEVYPGGTVSWASSDETVAAVDENGCVTAVGEGTAVITVTVSIGGKTWSDRCTVTVTDVPAEGDGPEAEDGGATVIVPGPEAMEVPGKPEGVSDEAFHQAVTDAKEGVVGMAENTAVAGNPNAVSGIGEAVLAAGLLGENEKAEISLEQRLEHVEFAAELIKDADGTVTGVKLVPRKLVFDVSAFLTLLNEKDEPILSTKKPLNMDSSLMKRKYFTFRLPVPASVEERYANVEHEGEGVRQYTIAGSGNSRYIPVETWHLSRFTVTFTDQKLVPESHGGSGGGKTGSYGARGRWIQDAAGWWYQNPDRTWPSNTWIVLEWNGQNTWYHFNEKGYMVSGWYLDTDGNWYFLHNKEDGTQGHMYIGWKQIDGKWYYFRENAGGPQGSLLVNGVTPDGYTADGNGVCAEYPGR